MLLPKMTMKKIIGLFAGDWIVVAILWLGMLGSLQWGPGHSSQTYLLLLVLTGTLVGLSLGEFFWLNKTKSLSKSQKIVADLSLVVGLIGLLLLLFPHALTRLTVISNPSVLGLIWLILAVALAYVPRNHLVGIRLPWTYDSDRVWQQTNLLGARLVLGTGCLTILANGLGGLKWGIGMLLVGSIGMLIAVIPYSLWVVRHP
ncbi:SdpI family protein [Levilactobacillus yonginensis]